MSARSTLTTTGAVDFDKLEAGMAAAVSAEERHARENAAKFRAVAQRVPSYEAFEDMVKAAHIKPMTEDITQLSLKKSSWIAGGRAQERERKRVLAETTVPTDGSGAATATDDASLPTTAVEFTRHWQALATDHDRYAYLVTVGGKRLYKLFKLDMGHDIIAALLRVLQQSYKSEDAEAISLLLRAIVKTERFDLEVAFLNAEEQQMGSSLVERLQTDGRPEDELVKLRGKFA